MRYKISATIESDVIKWLETQIKAGRFRNISHGLECCTRLVRDQKIV